MGIFISAAVREKLLHKHQVTEAQIIQCFANRTGRTLYDKRAQHLTDPLTEWFIAETDYGIKLKVCFVLDPSTGVVEIKSAFPPNAEEIRIYKKYGEA